jgi:hypothetical protein
MPKREKPFHLDMPFDEALRRYVQADPEQLNKKQTIRKPKRKARVRSFESQPSPPKAP